MPRLPHHLRQLVDQFRPGPSGFERGSGAPFGNGRRSLPGASSVVGRAHGGRVDRDVPVNVTCGVRLGLDLLEKHLPVPSADQRRCRSWTVLHGPYRSGRSRHCTPVRIRCGTPFTTCRWSRHLPQRPLLTGRSGSSRSHWASVRSPRLPIARSTNHGLGGRGSRSILSALASSSGCNRRLALNSSMPRSRPCES